MTTTNTLSNNTREDLHMDINTWPNTNIRLIVVLAAKEGAYMKFVKTNKELTVSRS